MSDSDEDNMNGGGVSLAGFLFGNIDTKTGQLEDNILDEEAQRHLSALQKFGLGSMMNEVMLEEGKVTKRKKKKKKRRSTFDDESDSDDDGDSDDDDEEDDDGDDENEEDDEEEEEGEIDTEDDDHPSQSNDSQSSGERKIDNGSKKKNKNTKNKNLKKSLSFQNKLVPYDDDYDDHEKSPSAIDFFDIAELADEDVSTTLKTNLNSHSSDNTDYDEEEEGNDNNDEQKRRQEENQHKLMPPPPVPPPSKPTSLQLPSTTSTTTTTTTSTNLISSSSTTTSSSTQLGITSTLSTTTPVTSLSSSASSSIVASSTSLSTTSGASTTTDSGTNNNSQEKKLETPLAAMLPSKYVGVDVNQIFPDFRHDKIPRFARLFGPGKSGSLPQWWKHVKKRRKKIKGLAGDNYAEERDEYGWDWHFGEEPTDLVDEEEKEFLSKAESVKTAKDPNSKSDKKQLSEQYPKTWRHGPAAIWYDMLGIPEDEETLDYGFKLKSPPQTHSDEDDSDDGENIENLNPKNKEDVFSDEVFHMVTQLNWENSIIWDGTDPKYKKLNKNLSAGWVPSGINRTAQNFSQPGKNSPCPTSSSTLPSSSSSAIKTPGSSSTNSPAGSSAKAKALAAVAAANKNEDSGFSGLNVHHSDDAWYSIFPVETGELVHGRWEDEVIWDTEAMDTLPKPKVLSIDPNDDNIVLCIPDDVDPNAAAGTAAPVKVKIPHPHVKKSKILLGKAGVINVIEEDSPPPSPKNDDKDPYNISNDEYYQPKHTEQSMLKISASGNIIQHSTPVVELRAPFVPTHMGAIKLRNFHRPALKKYSHGPLASPGPHVTLPLTKHIQKKAKQREQERLAAGGGDIFFMRTPDDLTGKDGELLLFEYCEEHPPLLNQVGMCSKIKNYYKRKAGKDSGPPDKAYGETTYAHTSPFLGAMHPGETIQTIENNLYRAPIYDHPTPKGDFLIIRTRLNYFIREFDTIFTVGQECPLYEVPGPNSKRANNFVRDFLQVFIYRLFWKSRDNPRRIKMDDIKKAFPMHSESSIRKRLKLCADFKRTGADSNWWVIKPEFRLPTEEEIRAMVSPEQCCAYFSLIAAEQRLKDAGYGEKFLFAPQDDEDEENQGKIDDEVKVAPWNTTRAYIQAMKGKCLLQLLGPADPTGCGEGFSYIRVPNKPQTSKEEQEAQPKRIVTGTDADLRRLSLNNAKALLRKFGVPEEEIKKLSRWEVIDVVRTLSTEKAKAGEKGMTKFSRGNRFSVAEHQERYKEECQRIFELQNRVLASHEVLSTDEGESSEDELSDIEEMGKNIENMLSNKKTSSQLNFEKEEQERRELQQMIMGDGKDSKKDDDKQSKKAKKKDEEVNSTLSGLANHPGRVLKIHRTFRNADGKEYTRTEIVRQPAIIDIYMRIRTTKDENFIRQFALMDDQAKEEMKKEKRRIQEQLRRIKRNQEKEVTKKEPQRKKKIKLKPELKMKCGACGEIGHMKTNKACPLYQKNNSPVPSVNVAMTEEQEEEIEKEIINDDSELVKVDGTKVQLSSKLLKHAEEIKRRSLLIKVPKDAVGQGGHGVGRPKKKRVETSPHCDYLLKHGKTTNRRRVDPQIVMGGIFEAILNEIKTLPDITPFMYPVNQKQLALPSYFAKVKQPMDLQTIREKIRAKKYQTRAEFLKDVKLIADNSAAYNGENSLLTVSAYRMYDLCNERLMEKEDKLTKLEKIINPLLDDDDQKGLNYILEIVLSKVKSLKKATPFIKPVNKKQVKDYYEKIKKPMDLDMIGRKIQNNKYHSRYDFLADMELIAKNAETYNGPNSGFAKDAAAIVEQGEELLEEFNDKLTSIENNIQKARAKAKDRGEDEEDEDAEDEDDDITSTFSATMDDDTGFSVQDDQEIDYPPSNQRTDGEDMDDFYPNSVNESTRQSLREDEEEEGEYFSDEDSSTARRNRKKMRLSRETDEEQPESNMDDDTQAEAIEAMLELSKNFVPSKRNDSSSDSVLYRSQSQFDQSSSSVGKPGPSTLQTVHDDLEVSDSEDDEADTKNNNSDPDDDDGGLWF